MLDNMADIHEAEQRTKEAYNQRIKSFPHCHHFQMGFKDSEHGHIQDKHIVLSFDRSVARSVFSKHIMKHYKAYGYKTANHLMKNLMVPEESTSYQVTLYDDQVKRMVTTQHINEAPVEDLIAMKDLIDKRLDAIPTTTVNVTDLKKGRSILGIEI